MICICWLMARLWFSHRKSLYLLSFLAAFPLTAIILVKTLGFAGQINNLGICLGQIILLSGLLTYSWRRNKSSFSFPHSSPFLIAFFLLAFAALGFAAGKQWLPQMDYGPDGLSYHAVFVAETVQNQDLTLAMPSYAAEYYPYNSEIISLWFCLPFHNDVLVGMTGCYWLALLALCVYLLSWRSAGEPFTAFLLVFLCLSLLPVQEMAKSFAATDLAGPVMLLAAILFFTDRQDDESNFLCPDIGFAGLCLGFAFGVKTSLLFALPLFVLYESLFAKRFRSIGFYRHFIPLFLGGILLICGFWYIRNWLVTGNPFFPAEIGPFDGAFTKENQYLTTIIRHLREGNGTAGKWRYLTETLFNWPYGLFFLAVAGYVLFVIKSAYYLFKKTPPLSSSQPMVLVALLGLTSLILHPFMPFSGGVNSITSGFFVQSRYLILFGVSGLLLLVLAHGRNRIVTFTILFLVILVRTTMYGLHFKKFLIIGGVVVCILGARWLIMRKKDVFFSCWRNLGPVFCLCFLIGLMPHLDYIKAVRKKWLYNFAASNDVHDRFAWQAVERFEAGTRLCRFGDIYRPLNYPYYGRKYQAVPVYVDRNGALQDHIHIRWRRDKQAFDWWKRKADFFEPERLVGRLLENQLEYVITIKNNGQWPEQDEVFLNDRRCELVSDEEFIRIWRLPRKLDFPFYTASD